MKRDEYRSQPYDEGVRWLPVTNVTGADIPPHSVVEAANQAPDGSLYIQLPTSDNSNTLMVTDSCAIPASDESGAFGTGHATFDMPVPVRVTQTDRPISTNDMIGVTRGDGSLSRLRAGYQVLGPISDVTVLAARAPSDYEAFLKVFPGAPRSGPCVEAVEMSVASERLTATNNGLVDYYDNIALSKVWAYNVGGLNPLDPGVYRGTLVSNRLGRRLFYVINCCVTSSSSSSSNSNSSISFPPQPTCLDAISIETGCNGIDNPNYNFSAWVTFDSGPTGTFIITPYWDGVCGAPPHFGLTPDDTRVFLTCNGDGTYSDEVIFTAKALAGYYNKWFVVPPHTKVYALLNDDQHKLQSVHLEYLCPNDGQLAAGGSSDTPTSIEPGESKTFYFFGGSGSLAAQRLFLHSGGVVYEQADGLVFDGCTQDGVIDDLIQTGRFDGPFPDITGSSIGGLCMTTSLAPTYITYYRIVNVGSQTIDNIHVISCSTETGA